ncbi:MAG TPA: transposase [Oligoflexus sp.]|uniref:IS66 family insertion sequence element accessory protein TnpA n=1 Tax=Oligoflexus sp. TaxID=1971216 RepID=UPI002D5D915D|nr:transposase [Oligoflexus sp.]HYX36491.1 transposase [Oligoflexus sp.]
MKRWTMKVRRAILKEWESSEMTRKDFCKRHGMSISSLRHWKEMVSENDNPPEIADVIKVDSIAAVSTAPRSETFAFIEESFQNHDVLWSRPCHASISERYLKTELSRYNRTIFHLTRH